MAIIDFTIHVDNPDDIYALFDRIQVWRSPDQGGSPTPYSEITANEPTAAVVDGTIAGPWNLNGKVLTVLLDAADPKDVTFTGSNPLTLQTVISQINAVFPGLASEVPTDTGKIRLASSLAGTQSIIEAIGDATTVLGISNAHTNGKGPRPLISATTEDYLFRDYDGLNTYWYKTRYYNSVTGAVSLFSSPRKGGLGSALSGSLVVTGTVAVADLTGAPVPGIRIIFVPILSQLTANTDSINYGIFPSVNRIEVLTNSDGQASCSFVIGQRVKMFIEGTMFHREFTVPDENFDVLSLAIEEPDPFGIVAAPPMAIKVS